MTDTAAMLDLLRDLEWSGRSGLEGEDVCCPECGSGKDSAYDVEWGDEHGHGVTCRLSRFIHGPVAPERLERIAKERAAAQEERRREQERIAAMTKQQRQDYVNEQRSKMLRHLDEIRGYENDLFHDYVASADTRPAWLMANAITKGTK